MDYKLKLKQVLDSLDANSGTALFILLINTIGIFWFNAVHNRTTDSGLITYALGVVASKTAHGVFAGKNNDNDPTPPTQGNQ